MLCRGLFLPFELVLVLDSVPEKRRVGLEICGPRRKHGYCGVLARMLVYWAFHTERVEMSPINERTAAGAAFFVFFSKKQHVCFIN